MKEQIIENVIINLVDKIGIDNTNIVKNELIIQLKDVEIKNKETSLIPYNGSRENIVKKFLAIKKLSGCTNRTLGAYLTELKIFLKKINKNLEDIQTDDIRLYLALSRKNATNITIDNKRRYLNSFFEWCVDEEIIKRNPVKKVDKIKTTKKVKEAFTELEIEKMRNHLIYRKERCVLNQKGHEYEMKYRNIAIFETLLSTGMRVSELVSINKDQLDFENGEILILGKGNKERKVYLNTKSQMAIKNYLDKRKDCLNCLFIAYTPTDGEAHRITISGVEMMIRKLGKDLKIESYPHKFRRTTATIATFKGMPIEQVQKMLGHSSLNTTQIYVNLKNSEVKSSHEKYFN